ncbi:MAG: hypothetical protein Q8P41_30335 [Pseudomonadota bacterium]|nr:hypothetical protein [Pseudomonadota bacterium]
MAPIWALVTFTADGECLVDRTSLRASMRMDGDPTFGADFDGDDDFGDDDFGDDDFGDDDLGDDDLGDDDLGDDDFGDDDLGDDDLGDDDLGDDVGAARKRRRRRARPGARRARAGSGRASRLARKNKQLEGRLKKAKKGKVVERNVTVTGSVATSVGQAMSMTLTPRTSLHLSKIFATGDTAATINTIISGDDPVVLDNLDAALISPSAYHGPSFGGRVLRAGVPVTINYSAGSTTAALKLSFYGKARVKNPSC